jgi:hypothetical protein
VDSRPNSNRDDPAPTPAAELTAMLWCLAVLLAVLLLAYWWSGEIYSS